MRNTSILADFARRRGSVHFFPEALLTIALIPVYPVFKSPKFYTLAIARCNPVDCWKDSAGALIAINRIMSGGGIDIEAREREASEIAQDFVALL